MCNLRLCECWMNSRKWPFTLEQNFYSIDQFYWFFLFTIFILHICPALSSARSVQSWQVSVVAVIVRVEALWAFCSILDIWRFQMENEAAPFDLQPFLFLIQSWEMKWHPTLWTSWCSLRLQIPPWSQGLEIRGSTLTNATWPPLWTPTPRFNTKSLTTTGEVTLQTKVFGGLRLNVSSFSSCLIDSKVSESTFVIGDSPTSQKFVMPAFLFNTGSAAISSQVHPEQVQMCQSSLANGISLFLLIGGGKCLSATLHALSAIPWEFYSKPDCQGLHVWFPLQEVSWFFRTCKSGRLEDLTEVGLPNIDFFFFLFF